MSIATVPASFPSRARPVLRVHLLGGFEAAVHADDDEPLAEQPRHLPPAAMRLLACLGLRAPQPVSRERLSGWLYPDLGDAAARRALTDALYRLRCELANGANGANGANVEAVQRWLQADVETIRLSLDHATIDVREFRHLAKSSELPSWQGAVALYRGDLLEDLDCEWAEAARAELRELYLDTLERACATLMQTCTRADDGAALVFAQRWARADGLCEAAHCAVMKLHARLGQYAHALDQYNRLEAHLRREIGIPPMPETQALAEAIRTRALEQAGLLLPARIAKSEDQRTETACTVIQRLEQSGEWREAAHLHRRAGDRAETSQAHEDALGHYGAGLRLLSLLPADSCQSERLALLGRRQRVFGRQFKLADWRADVEAIERLTATEPVSAAQLLAREARIALNALDSNVAGMVAAGEQALALARTMNSPVAGTRVAITYAAHLSEAVGQHDQALQLLHAALARLDGSDANRNGPLLTQALCALAHAQARMGVAGPARETALRALTLTQLNPRLYAARADALHALGCADAQLGDWQSALAELHAAEQLHRDLGNVAAHLDVLRELAITRTMTGQHAKAQADFASWFAVSERAGLPTSSDMWRAAAADCAWALVTAGRVEAAEHALRPLMDWMQHGGAPWPRARAWTALAMLRMTQGQPGQAREALRPACKLSEQWHMCDATATLHLALVAQHLGDRALAEASLARADALSHGRERAHEAALLNWARYRVRGCLHSLAAARDELHRQAEHLTDRGDRQAFLVGVPLHRDIEAAWQRAQGAQSAAHMQRNVTEARETDATSLVMALARADAPLGRPLERDERVHVRLTIDAGPHDADVLQHEGKAGLRRHRLRRLIEQARGQGAAPTDADLARALNVNIRTIERDMAALRATRAGPLTRRRAARRMSIGVCRDGVEATQCTRERRDTARLSCD